jgi:hypothetical protein
MAHVTRTYPDNTRTTSQMSGDNLPGQTRTYTFRYVQMSGVRILGMGCIDLVIGTGMLIFNYKHLVRSTSEPSWDEQRESASAFSCFAALCCHSTHRLTSGRLRGIADPCASRSSVGLHDPPNKPLRHSETHDCHHLSDDQKGIYARVANQVFHSVEAVRRARTRQPLAKRLKPSFCEVCRPSRGGGVGVGPNASAFAYIDLSIHFRGGFLSKLAFWAEKSDGPKFWRRLVLKIHD